MTSRSEQETAEPASKKVTVITPPSGWGFTSPKELWSYHELLFYLIWRDVVVRYKQTVLGTAWALLQPLATTFVWSIIFGHFIQLNNEIGSEPYPIFLLCGLLPWNLFSGGLAGSSSSVLSSSSIITKIYFPRVLIPVASVGVNLVNFAVTFVMLIIVMLCYGQVPGPQILLVPVVVALVFIATLSLGIGLSAAMVLYRDVRYLSPFFLQMLLYVSPVIFPVSIIPKQYQWILALNPMTGLIELFRWTMYGKPFDLTHLYIGLVVTVVLLCISSAVFRQAESKFADII